LQPEFEITMATPEITIYSTMFCPYCSRAKRLLDQKGQSYHEIDVDITPGARQEMMARAHGRHTVPQIFIGERHVGGCDDLFVLEYNGELDALLSA
jgi:glutaredoxin 3